MPTLRRLRQEDHEFKPSLELSEFQSSMGYIYSETLSQKNLLYSFAITPYYLSLLPLATNNLLSISLDLPILSISYE
jgi:hypothetical protein